MLLAQDGHGPASKIEKGLDKQIIDGAVFCPRTNSPEKLSEVTSYYRGKFNGGFFCLDPNFCVSTLSATKIGKLDSYPFFYPNLKRTDFSPRKLQTYVQQTIDYQNNLPLSAIISPGVLVSAFTHHTAHLNLQFYEESSEYLNSNSINKNLFFCLPLAESSLREEEQLNEYLDDLTRLNGTGFYILVERTTKDAPQWNDPTNLSNFLYLIYVLSQNDYKVIVAYSDLVGTLFKIVGAEAIVNGWWRNLKQFTQDRYLEQGGGRQPRTQYTSQPLLNSIFINSELQPIFDIGLIENVISGTEFDGIFMDNPATQAWEQEKATLHHWTILNNLEQEISKYENIQEKLELFKSKIASAQALYSQLKGQGITFETISNNHHLKVWQDALLLFEQNFQ